MTANGVKPAGRGKRWIAVTSQEKLSEIVSGLDDKKIELARLMDRFPQELQVHLEPSDISEVTSKRVLTKSAPAQKVLGELFDEQRARFTELTRLRASGVSRPGGGYGRGVGAMTTAISRQVNTPLATSATLLRAGSNKALAKIWTTDGRITPAANATWFQGKEGTVASVADICLVLDVIEKWPRVALVKEALAPGVEVNCDYNRWARGFMSSGGWRPTHDDNCAVVERSGHMGQIWGCFEYFSLMFLRERKT